MKINLSQLKQLRRPKDIDSLADTLAPLEEQRGELSQRKNDDVPDPLGEERSAAELRRANYFVAIVTSSLALFIIYIAYLISQTPTK